MPRLRRLSAVQLVEMLNESGFERIGQNGSHIKLRRLIGGQRQTLIVPLHRSLDTGTLRAIVRQATKYLSEAETSRFYEE